MDFIRPEQKRIFDETKCGQPKDLAEFNISAQKAVEEIAGSFGIIKAEYSLSLSRSCFSDMDYPRDLVLYDEKTETENEPLRFEYELYEGGRVEFVVYTKNELSSDERWLIEVDLRQLYYILNELVLELSCESLSLTDFQTGIPNSKAFMRFASKVVEEGKLSSYTALVFNIHNFKSVHRSFSYIEGNKVLKKYSRIIAEAVTKNEIVARTGGDNFIAMILNDHLDYFLDLLHNMVVFHEKDGDSMTFMFGATIGGLKLSDDYDVNDIMLNTSVAYQGARERRQMFNFYDKKLSENLMERKIVLSKFHKALIEKEFYAVYQPKVGVNDLKLHGAEALVRWKHEGKDIMPGKFVPVFEQDGCICMLDFFMLEEVCKFIRRLIDNGLKPVRISVNFSKRHLLNNKLVEEIAEVIDRYGIPHELIEVELTESENSHSQGVMSDVVNDLGALGIKTSIDDFGTGYSSLGMLKQLDLDVLKIDKSFIPEAPVSDNDKSFLMLKGIIALAKSLGFTIVAEGVETSAQFELIEGLGCDVVQGFIFDKPLSESDFIERIKNKDYVLE
ncbi:MAG: EAL domain-containing protein [Oscillospiraceae bacterium]|nr:EAL domain-containing protein [Oscillospiraceae bacterium]